MEDYKRTATIIRGNPLYDRESRKLISDLKTLLQTEGYRVRTDRGRDHTTPKESDLYIGHSRGAERLRFINGGIRIPIGSSLEGAINHPLDRAFLRGSEPDSSHFTLSDEMREELLRRIRKQKIE